jgi:hypothetical protein
VVVGEKGVGVVVLGRVGEVRGWVSLDFVVILRGCEAEVVVVLEVALVVWEVAAREVGEPTVGADLA